MKPYVFYTGLFDRILGFIWVRATSLGEFDESITRQLAELERSKISR